MLLFAIDKEAALPINFEENLVESSSEAIADTHVEAIVESGVKNAGELANQSPSPIQFEERRTQYTKSVAAVYGELNHEPMMWADYQKEVQGGA